MQRRQFIGLMGAAAAAWPVAAYAQQMMPVSVFSSGQSPNGYTPFAAAFS